MPQSLAEMRQDVTTSPTTREFVVVEHRRIGSGRGAKHLFTYYNEDHDDLGGKLRILDNVGFVRDITYGSLKRYVFAELFVDYLTGV